MDVVKEASVALTELFDIVASKDVGNTLAKADLVVDGQVLAPDLPVTYMLFLEKQLTDWKTFIAALPTLDSGEKWSFNEAENCWTSEPTTTTRNKKALRNHVKAEATDKHPAQVEVYKEDVLVGYWKTIKLSGAVPKRTKNRLMDRIEKLQQAVKFAREKANSTEVAHQRIGHAIFSYLTEA